MSKDAGAWTPPPTKPPAPGDDMRARLVEALETRPLLAAWEVRLVSVAPGCVELEMPLGPHLAVADPAHGGCDRSLIVAIGDAAGWLGVVSGTSPGTEVATVEMKVDLVVPRTPVTTLIARSEVVRQGRSLSTVRTRVQSRQRDGADQAVGFVDATYMMRRSACSPGA